MLNKRSLPNVKYGESNYIVTNKFIDGIQTPNTRRKSLAYTREKHTQQSIREQSSNAAKKDGLYPLRNSALLMNGIIWLFLLKTIIICGF